MSAEGTFLRMLRKSADAYGNIVQLPGAKYTPMPSYGNMVPLSGAGPMPFGFAGYNRQLDMRSITNRNGIDSIKYIENETLKERFMDCKKVI